jgi:hypothetical protein
MNFPRFSHFPKFAALTLLVPMIAGAHPGHDGGHGLTWDLSGGIEHAKLPLGCLILLGLTVLVVKIYRSRSES